MNEIDKQERMKPLLSIIVPVYNAELYIRKCLDSLLGQTLQNIEIICINDASQDSSLEILREYEKQDKRVTIINLTKNLGPGGARNEGLKLSKASFVAFTDQDDWVDIYMFEKLYVAINKENADIALCDYYDCKGESLERKINILSKNIKVKDNKKFVLYSVYLWTGLFKKSLFTDHDLYFPYHLGEDLAIIHVLFMLSRSIVHLKEPLYYYRIHSSSTIHKNPNCSAVSDLVKSVNLFLANARRLGLDKCYRDEIEYIFIRYRYDLIVEKCLSVIVPIPVNEIKSARKELLNLFPLYKNNYYYRSEPFSKSRFIHDLIAINPWLGIVCAKTSKAVKRIIKKLKTFK